MKAEKRARRLNGRWFPGLALAAIAVGAIAFFSRHPDQERPSESALAERPIESVEQPVVPESPAPPETEPTTAPGATLLDQEWDDLIARTRSAVAGGSDRTRQFVYALFAELDRLSPADRLEVVLGFFESGRDVDLGGRMTIGRGGILQDWPTLRTALFDYLSQRDGSAARDLAQLLLQSRPDEPGEWTLALRELARGRSAEQWTPLVQQRMHDFIGDEQWRQESRISWLEGFDVVVAGREPSNYLPDLAAVAGDTNPRGAQFAAFLAADRLMLAEPEETLSTLNQNPQLFADQANVRAGLFARADVRQSAQLHELETYFRRADVAAEEREAFAGLFPHYDLAVSFNLLTLPSSRSMADMITHDRAAMARLETWLADPAFSAWHAGLEDVRERLREQLAEADRGK